MRKNIVFAIVFSVFISHFSIFAQVASESEMLKPRKVGRESLVLVRAEDVESGEYLVEVETSSSMFRVTEGRIFVSENEGGSKEMRAKITMSGKSYTKFFLGTAVQASQANGIGEIPFSENADGSYFFEFPILALNEAITCASFSKNKEKWYEREILFDAASLPEDALFVSPERLPCLLSDGSYLVEVKISGGSGKASVKSPAKVTVKEGQATAEIEWSSANYDYMKVNGERFGVDTKILSEGGNSTFLIPIYAFDKKMPVFADTTAMSSPHEILYRLEFDSKSAKKNWRLPFKNQLKL